MCSHRSCQLMIYHGVAGRVWSHCHCPDCQCEVWPHRYRNPGQHSATHHTQWQSSGGTSDHASSLPHHLVEQGVSFNPQELSSYNEQTELFLQHIRVIKGLKWLQKMWYWVPLWSKAYNKLSAPQTPYKVTVMYYVTQSAVLKWRNPWSRLRNKACNLARC